MDKSEIKKVYALIEVPGSKDRWAKVGKAIMNIDGTVIILLDSLPINGKLAIRNKEVKREKMD